MNKIQALQHEDIECARENCIWLAEKQRRAYEEFLEATKHYTKALEQLQKKERLFYGIEKAS